MFELIRILRESRNIQDKNEVNTSNRNKKVFCVLVDVTIIAWQRASLVLLIILY